MEKWKAVEDPGILDYFKNKYGSLKAQTFKEDGWKFDKNDVDSLKKMTLSGAKNNLRSFIVQFSPTEIYKVGEEAGQRDIDVQKIIASSPRWFTNMKLDITSVMNGFVGDYAGEDDFDFDEEKEFFEKLLRQWKRIKKPSNYKLFIDFYKKVASSSNFDFQSRIQDILKANKSKLETFFGVYFKDGLFGGFEVIRYASDWFTQMKRSIKSAIRVEHRDQLSRCMKKLDKVKLKSVRFSENFKAFYNSYVDALQENQSLNYLSEEMKPFLKSIEEKLAMS